MNQEQTQEQQSEPIGRATYSPEDNKLRLYADARLDAPTYARVKAAGFSWAPKQGLFVAPMWTPQRFDLLVDLCGEVGDEDSTLQERAEQRAERFARYKANRHRDAHAAADRVQQLTEHVPLGQPILVGHHSQQGAERIAKKINRAMETAVDQWSRHEYWTARIPAVIDHAEWKGDPRLRHRRIKGLEADERKFSESVRRHEQYAEAWSAEGLTSRRAWQLCANDRSGAYDILTSEGAEWLSEGLPAELIAKAAAHATEHHTNSASAGHSRRWLDHTRLRLAFERELMEQQGGDRSTRFDFAVGGKVQGGRWSKGAWQTILRVNKAAGKVNSLTCSAPVGQAWGARVPVEEVTAYEPPTDEGMAKAKKATTLAPLCNYPGEGFEHITSAEYKARGAWAKDTKYISSETIARHRVRSWISKVGGEGYSRLCPVFLTDAKTTHPPTKEPPPEPPTTPEPLPERLRFELDEAPQQSAPRPVPAQPSLFEDMAATLKAGGAQTVVAHQLYPTPTTIAERMAELAEVRAGMCVLEPSAGTGNIIAAIRKKDDRVSVVAVEVNHDLCRNMTHTLRQTNHRLCIVNEDFLSLTPSTLGARVDHNEAPRGGNFDAVLMNPPFENASDIKHVLHALTFLRDGGRLVGICADGPRQTDKLQPLCTSWEQLPAGTFAGTNVRSVLFTIDK